MHRGKVHSQNFKRGICTLVLIMLTFGASYMIRVLCDSFIIDFNGTNCYKTMMTDQFLGVPYDLFPIMLIVCLHRRNLIKNTDGQTRAKQVKYADEEDMLMIPMASDTSSTNSRLTAQNDLFDQNSQRMQNFAASLISLQKLTASND